MVDQSLETTAPEAEKLGQGESKKVYRRPALTKLGSLRDLTMTVSNSGASDGGTMPGKKNTGRGGNFDSTDCGQ